MKLCQNCGQMLAEEIPTCPSCGSEVVDGIKTIDDYRIEEVLHEGYATILCRAVKAQTDESVMIRIFSPQSGVDEKIAERLKKELEELKKLPEKYFVRHFEIRQSSEGLWYRVSEWLETENWGNLIASGVLRDYNIAFKLFYRMASILEGLHRIGHIIPHLILDDILVIKSDDNQLQIKIDYKLSRFLDPKLDRPGPLLKKLLACHPDIIQRRPLDPRSDIWSLGKIFVELMTAEHESADFQTEIDELTLPAEFELLLKSMLADDPGLRPQSMAEVAESLDRIKDTDIDAAMQRAQAAVQPPAQEIRSLKRRIGWLILVVGVSAILALLVWFFLVFRQQDTEKRLGAYANRYAKSVAFVMSEYWLTYADSVIYRNRTEGTAFLVDTAGYLLTNRHVACPWLEDKNLYVLIGRYLHQPEPLQLGYRIFLWFEGQKAFKRLPELSDDSEVEDTYGLSGAFRTDGRPRLKIAGVARAPNRTYQLIRSPLKDDFAVLKIDQIPEGLVPLPLDEKMSALAIPKLSPVIALGFPLGSRTQQATVNVSVTTGHVRRAFENLLQVDTSIHRGNSGGPIIDTRGKVIGIASGVAMDWIVGPIPLPTLLPDLGMVLPIDKAVIFLRELRAGKVKWNGVLDLSVETKVNKILDLAEERRWSDAQQLADRELQTSFDPSLVLAAAMIHFCAGDHRQALRLFESALSMDDKNTQARWLLYLIDWLADPSPKSPHRRELLNLDWRSPHEFYGHLVRVLEGSIPAQAAQKGGTTDEERNWLRYVMALAAARSDAASGAEALLQQVVLTTGRENWLHFLALSRLQNIWQGELKAIEDPQIRSQYRSDMVQFDQKLQASRREVAQRQRRLAPLLAQAGQEALDRAVKLQLLEQILEIDAGNGNVLVDLAFYHAMGEEWARALEFARRYLALNGRENAGRLKMGLLAAEILAKTNRRQEAVAELENYLAATGDRWYRQIAECLLDPQKQNTVVEKAGESPEYLLTGHVALAFWAEGKGDKSGAIENYREALGSYMDDTIEYAFAAERIKKLRGN